MVVVAQQTDQSNSNETKVENANQDTTTKTDDAKWDTSSTSSGVECELDDQQQKRKEQQQKPIVPNFDPDKGFKPEEVVKSKEINDFRNHVDKTEDKHLQLVRHTYYTMHQNQTVEFVRNRMAKWCKFDHAEMTIMEALLELNKHFDESDPDSKLPNIVHAFQTAERIRKFYPDLDWFQLTGLIHDLGKVLEIWGEEQWAVVGDTYIVGCEFPDSIVYGKKSFEGNPDLNDPSYNTKYGMYEPNCGLDNVLFCWGHDEYMYRVLKNHPQCTLPDEGCRIVRQHSLYPWHNKGEYRHLCVKKDLEILPMILEFKKFDLYSKSEPVPHIEALMPYYQSLIDKYIPGKVRW